MSENTHSAAFDDVNEADRLDQEQPAVPDYVDPENDPAQAEFDSDSEGSEADWLDQAEEIDIDDDQLNRG